jgi:hypothetical protein
MSTFRSGVMRVVLVGACLTPAASFAQTAPQPGVSAPYQLFTQDERLEYCTEMRNASTPEERQAIATRMHDTMVARAKEQGVTLPPGMGDGMPHMGRGARGWGMMRGMGCASMGPYAAGRPAVGAQSAAAFVPEVRHAGNIAYVTGGVGQDEADALRAVAPRYSMRATFAASNGEYLSDVAVRLEKSNGSVVFTARSDGPFLFAQVPPGRYRLVATYNQIERQRMIDVPARGGAGVTLTWPVSGRSPA